MNGVLGLVRADLRDFAGYASARRGTTSGSVWLNANESPWPNPADSGAGAHRYPDPQPAALTSRLAQLYGARPDQLLVGRGSDEAIDLLVRALCEPGRDAVVVTPPVFGMYAVSARLQGAPLRDVPLVDGPGGFTADLDAVADAAVGSNAKLVFLCSPGNPTGGAIRGDAIIALARRLEGRCVVVVDEAYQEYGGEASLAGAVAAQPNLAVLRTLSKAYALAAARIGCLIADPALVRVLRNCQAPYPLPAASVKLALAGLSDAAVEQTRARVRQTVAERGRVAAALASLPGVARVDPSQGNFLLVRFADADTALGRLLAAGVVVRDMRAHAALGDALRISIGAPAENDAMLSALAADREVA
jgi:histidinol-phosphate aminotransferase